jgi:hypothetical protein
MVALFTLSLNDLQAKSHDEETPVFIIGNYIRIIADSNDLSKGIKFNSLLRTITSFQLIVLATVLSIL